MARSIHFHNLYDHLQLDQLDLWAYARCIHTLVRQCIYRKYERHLHILGQEFTCLPVYVHYLLLQFPKVNCTLLLTARCRFLFYFIATAFSVCFIFKLSAPTTFAHFKFIWRFLFTSPFSSFSSGTDSLIRSEFCISISVVQIFVDTISLHMFTFVVQRS